MRGAPSLGTQAYLTHAGSATITDGGPHRRRRATARGPACAVTAPILADDPLPGPSSAGNWPSAGRSPSKSASQRPAEGPPGLRGCRPPPGPTLGYPRITRQRRFPAPLAPALTAAAPARGPAWSVRRPPPGPRSTADLLGRQAAAPPGPQPQPASQPLSITPAPASFGFATTAPTRGCARTKFAPPPGTSRGVTPDER